MNKDVAQRRADRIAAFRAELDELAREGMMPFDRAGLEAVSAHHDALLGRLAREFDIDTTAAGRRMSRGMQIASLLGAAALIAAIVSFVYRVWGTMPVAAQVALLTAAPLASLAGMLIAGRIEATRYVASLFAIVACGAFVLQTVVLGQLFNLRGSPHAVGAWAAFSIAVSVPWRFGVTFAWGTVALVLYLAALAMAAAGAAWPSFFQRPETVLVSAAVVLGASLRWPRELSRWARGVALILVLGSLLVLSATGVPSLLPFDPQGIRVLYQLAGAAAAVMVIGAGLRYGLGDVVVIGSLYAAAFILTRFVDWWWDWMPRYLFFLILAAVAIAWLWLLRLARRRLEARPT